MALAPILILNGKRVSNIDELRSAHDFEKLQIAAEHGRLLNWLRFHHYADLANDVESLLSYKDDPSFFEDVCHVLGIQCPKEYSALGKQMPSAIEYETELLPLMRQIIVNMLATYRLRNTDIEKNIVPTDENIKSENADDNIAFSDGLFEKQDFTILGLSMRAEEALKKAGITNLEQLCTTTPAELAKRSCGQLTIREIEQLLGNYSLRLGMRRKEINKLRFLIMPEGDDTIDGMCWLCEWLLEEQERFVVGQAMFRFNGKNGTETKTADVSGKVISIWVFEGIDWNVGLPIGMIEIDDL